MQKAFLGFLLLTLSSWAAAQPGKFSVAAVMGAPFASELVAAPVGASVAWVEYQQGRRNVWLATGPAWHGTQLTQFGDDDGQEISELCWSPRGDSLLFVRGGDAENEGENPNPDGLAIRPGRDIWQIDVSAGAASVRKLGEGHAPAYSPGGDSIVFVRGLEIFTMNAGGAGASAIVHDKGHVSSLTWSPKGKSLAFVSRRGEHSFVAVYTPGVKSIQYVDASVDEDVFPSWSPDGASLAFVRIPAGAEGKAGPHRADVPWSIRVAAMPAGKVREVFHATPGNGSVFHPVSGERQIIWNGSEKLVFPWEKTGWCHLYSVGSGGGEPLELTPGAGEVEFVSVNASGHISYSSNIGDLDARHVSEIGSPSRQVNTEEGIQTNPVSVADGSVLAFLAGSYNTPVHAVIRLQSGKVQDLHAAALPREFPVRDLVKPQSVLLSAADGLALHAQLFLPTDDGRKHPALVFFHGGSRRQMLPAFHYMFYYSNAYAMNQYLASQGFVVLSVNYRSGIGYGMDFREALNYGTAGASEYSDVTGAGLYLRSRSDVDGARIGAWGGSYGGYLTALALARSSDLFAAGVDFHGVHDWSTLRGYEMNAAGGDAAQNYKQQEIARVAFESSPIASVKDWRSPVLLIHGDDDRNVEFAQTEQLVKALRQQKVEFEQLIFPNEIHDFLLHRSWVVAYEASADFLKRKLMK